MRYVMLIGLVLGSVQGSAWAQDGESYLAGQRQPVHIAFQPLYQQLDHDGLQVTEFSVPVTAYFPLGRALGVSVQASQASASADGLASLTGWSDVQLAATYYQEVGAGSLVFGLAANLPSGTRQMTLDEFETLRHLSLNEYAFRVPGFGQGLGVTPSLTWAQPLSEAVVLGLGVSYQRRGAFEPIEGMAEPYDPGDEWLLTGGFDLRVSPAATLSADVSHTLYATDRVGDSEVFAASRRTVVSMQVRRTSGFNEVWLFGRYRSRGKNSVLAGGVLDEEAVKTTPDQAELQARYRHRLHRHLYAALHGHARSYEATPTFPDGVTLFGVGAAPEVILSRQVRVPLRFTYLFGDLTGLEAGVGLVVSL